MEKLHENMHVFVLSCKLNMKAQKHACFRVSFLFSAFYPVFIISCAAFREAILQRLLPDAVRAGGLQIRVCGASEGRNGGKHTVGFGEVR